MSADILVFRLYGPFASWGEVAVGEIRPTDVRPTRSALLGLLAAALGITRQDDSAHLELGRSIALATRVDLRGVAGVDYHTTNWRRPNPKKEVIRVRSDELRAPRHEVSTTQSLRSYRYDSLVAAACWRRASGSVELATLQRALDQPTFPLSLGRKCNAPALPLDPRILTAVSLAEALAEYDRVSPLPAALDRLRRRASRPPELAWELGTPLPIGVPPHRVEQRRDDLLSRRRWRFSVRSEGVGTFLPEPKEASPCT